MCLIISLFLLYVSVNLFLMGDIMMGLGTLIMALGLLFFMIRHIMQVKKERGKIDVKECIKCQK